MQLEGVRLSWASKRRANTGWESCQWVGRGAVQSSPCRGLAHGVQAEQQWVERGKPMDPSEFKTKPQRRRTLRKAYTKTEGIYYVFFKEDRKTGQTRDPIPHHYSKKKKRAQIWPQRGKTLPPTRVNAKDWPRRGGNPSNTNSFFSFLEKDTRPQRGKTLPPTKRTSGHRRERHSLQQE